MRPRLLDLFCKAGGAAMGYHRAGFDVVGVDHESQRRYPFEFHEADALEFLLEWGEEFDVIHASPPCQRYSWASFTVGSKEKHPDLVAPTRDLLLRSGRPWVMENVASSPLSPFAVTLCGLMFGLKVFRHRRFECSDLLMVPEHPSHRGKLIGKEGMCCVVGHGGGVSRRVREQMGRHGGHGAGGQQNKAEWQVAMGIDWMTRNEMSQAVPPAYTEYVGKQLLRVVEGSDARTR